MSETLADWLAVREPADIAARSVALTDALVRHLASTRPLRILELGTGTGSNIRYLAPRLGGMQEWLAVDRDLELLTILPLRLTLWASAQRFTVRAQDDGIAVSGPELDARVSTRRANLADLGPSFFAGRNLVTASALLDLVSEEWLRVLAGHCANVGAAALFALTYTGESSCTPVEAEDDWIRDLLNRHQQRDKSLGGCAAGPAATDAAVDAFTVQGYEVHADASPWRLGSSETELQRQLIEGWAQAAREMEPGAAARIDEWRLRRLAHLHAGDSRIVVQHLDVAALPRAVKTQTI